jgi:hypothetical protein
MTRALSAALLGLSLSFAAVAAAQDVQPAPAPSNQDVENNIEEITKPPDYDWLRGPRVDRSAGKGRPGDRPPRTTKKPSPVRQERAEGRDSCGYEPEQQGGPGDGPAPRDRPLPEGEGCGSGPAPGGGEVPSETGGGGCGGDSPGGGCGAEGALGDCGCDKTIGDCGCDRVGGSPASCGGLGAVGSGLGYVLGVVALGLIVFLIVRAILRRDRSSKDEGLDEGADIEAPEEMRVSEVAAMPAETMMERAARAAAEGDYRTAVGWSYLAGIASLHQAGFADLKISTTNLAIVSSTKRKGGPHGAAARLIRVFEELFFGGREALLAHWEECRRIVEKELVLEPAH